MFRTCSTAITLASLVGLLVSGCAVDTPLTPAPAVGSGSSGPDGSTLKAGAPTLVSPINSDTVTTQRPTLMISAATGLFANQAFQYEFELQTDGGAVVTRATVSSLTFTVPSDLGVNGAFRWRARAVLSGAAGPYSALGRFQTPRLTAPGVGASHDEWKAWFLALVT